jgi:hypothetical protein
MATYTLISSNVLASSAASVTFSSIPATYTDLVIKCSARDDRAGSDWDDLKLVFNSDTATNYSETFVQGTGAAATSSRDTSIAYGIAARSVTGSTATASTFGSAEIYIPSYTASQNKPYSNFGNTESNVTNAFIAATALLWRNTAAITSIVVYPNNASNFVTGSSFYLYGISNA